jgi:hypothetical protein
MKHPSIEIPSKGSASMRMPAFVLGPMAALLVTGCAAMEDPADPELTTAAASNPCIGCAIPPITEWHSRMDPEDYVPPGTTQMQTMLTQGDTSNTFYAWGIANGRVRYIHHALKRDFEAYMGELAQGWKTMTSPTAHLSYGIGGSISSPPPRHPPQPGEPPFSQDYADIATLYGFDAQQAAQHVIGQLSGTP